MQHKTRQACCGYKENNKIASRGNTWTPRRFRGCRPTAVRSPNSRQPALFEFGTGFLPPETDAPKGPEDDVSAQRPETATREAPSAPIAQTTARPSSARQLVVGQAIELWDGALGRNPSRDVP